MFKHLFWGIIVLMLATIGGYVALIITGHPEAAYELGGAVLLAAFAGMIVFSVA